MKKETLGMAFGVFDGLHEGHRNFLLQALAQCERLVVSVAQDSIVARLKGAAPRHALAERIAALLAFDSRISAIPGDAEHESWQVLAVHEPDIVFAGYDQRALIEALVRRGIEPVILEPYEPHKFKSSILNG